MAEVIGLVASCVNLFQAVKASVDAIAHVCEAPKEVEILAVSSPVIVKSDISLTSCPIFGAITCLSGLSFLRSRSGISAL